MVFLPLVGLYIAPEFYKNEIFDRSVDAFSFSLILYEVCRFKFSFGCLSSSISLSSTESFISVETEILKPQPMQVSSVHSEVN